MRRKSLVWIVFLGSVWISAAHAAPTRVQIMRLPDGGVQPQVVTDGKNTIDVIYLQGDPGRSDVFHIRSIDAGKTFSKPHRVNSQPGSAIAMGSVRGAQLARGRNGRLYVAWMGSGTAEPKAPGKATPMLFTRSTEDGSGFEPQRNVITLKVGLDGGGSVAADEKGNVYVAWHAPNEKRGNEADRRVWVARSADEGKTFAPEVEFSDPKTGACGCCGMKLLADAEGHLFALYRAAEAQVNRGTWLIRGDAKLRQSADSEISPMKSGTCIMSTYALAPGASGIHAAWENQGRIFWGSVAANASEITDAQLLPGKGPNRKHPALASNAIGETIVAWTEGTGWNKGGSVGWQVFDTKGSAVPNSAGKSDDLPTWGTPAAFARPDGSFVVVF